MKRIMMFLLSISVLLVATSCSLAEKEAEMSVEDNYLNGFKLVLDDKESTVINVKPNEKEINGSLVDMGFETSDRRLLIDDLRIKRSDIDGVVTKEKGFTGDIYFVKGSVNLIKIYGTNGEKDILQKEISLEDSYTTDVITIKRGELDYLKATFNFIAVDPLDEVRYLYYDENDDLIVRYTFKNSEEYLSYASPKGKTIKYAVVEEVRETKIQRTLHTKQEYHVIAFKDDAGILGKKYLQKDEYYCMYIVYIGLRN